MKKKNKVNYWLIILIVLLAVILVLSRMQRGAKRAFFRTSEVEQKIDTNKVNDLKINQDDMKIVPDIDKNYLLGKVTPAESSKMTRVSNIYSSRDGLYMHKEAYEAFKKMHEAAQEDGINLIIISAMRTFDHQKRIWENKWNGRQILFGDIYATDIESPTKRALEILRFSAMPGTSRHHWGTDIDLNSLNNNFFKSGDGLKIYQWLQENALKYGFCQPYTPHGKERGGGYEEEKWHWSYMPVANDYYTAYINKISYNDISGFDGSETSSKLNVIKNYVKEIDPECKP